MREIERNYENEWISIEDDFRSTTIYIHKNELKYNISWYIKDDAFNGEQIYDYRISTHPLLIEQRLQTRYTEPPRKDDVRDYVIQESQILQNRFGNQKETIENYKKEVKWHEMGSDILFYFICKLHPEKIKESDWMEHLSREIERVNMGVYKTVSYFSKDNKDKDLEILESEEGKYIWYKEDKIPESDKDFYKNKTKIIDTNFTRPYFDKDSKNYVGISETEFRNHKNIIKTLEEIRDEKPIKKTRENYFNDNSSYVGNNTSQKYGFWFKFIVFLIILILIKILFS